MRNHRLLTATAFAALLAATSGAGALAAGPIAPAPTVKAAGDIVSTARASGEFKTFLKAAEATNLTGLLQKTQNITVFAPTDAAFAALPPGELDKLMLPENKAELQKLLVHHIVNARLPSDKFAGAKGPVPTVAGDNLQIDGSAQPVKVDGADIVQADVMASNGVLHVVDKVLAPGATATAATGADASASASAPATSTQKAGQAPNAAPVQGTTKSQEPAKPQP